MPEATATTPDTPTTDQIAERIIAEREKIASAPAPKPEEQSPGETAVEGEDHLGLIESNIYDQLDEPTRKRLREQEKGFQKNREQVKALQDSQTKLDQFNAALADPNTAPHLLRSLAQQVAKNHNLDIHELLGEKAKAEPKSEPLGDLPKVANWKDFTNDWEQYGFDSPGEYKLALKTHELDQRIQALDAKDRARDEQGRFVTYVEGAAPSVIAECAASDLGWAVTPAMVREAVANIPQLRDKPAEAVKRWFSEERANHLRKAVAGAQTKPAPTMLPTVSTKGPELDPKGWESRDAAYWLEQITNKGKV